MFAAENWYFLRLTFVQPPIAPVPMRPSPIVNDVLWQCLQTPACRSVRRARLSPNEFQQRLRHIPWRPLSNGSRSVSWGVGKPAPATVPSSTPLSPLTVEVSPATPKTPNASDRKRRSRTACWSHLRESARNGQKLEAQTAVKELIFHYNEQPSVQMYSNLIAAETDPQHGCAADVERLLEELDAEGLPRELEVYSAALKVLAVHPDHILREMLLDEMKRKWLELNSEHWHHIVTGMVRERQLELALERLGAMRAASVQPEPWLLHLLITTCLSVSAFPEAMSLLEYRGSYGEPIPSAIWAEALSKAAQSFSHPLVDFVWRRAVETNYMNPSSGTCEAVLNTAARRGNFRLAADVVRMLKLRSSPLELWHHEALFESYLQAADLPGALEALRTMAAEGKPATAATVRPLFLYLREERSRVDHALAVLAEHAAALGSAWDTKNVLDVCIEAYMAHKDLVGALKLFRSWHLYAPRIARPTVETFNALLYNLFSVAGSRDARRVAAALRRELREAGLVPDATTNNRLIFAFLADERDDEGLELALDVWKQMREAGHEVYGYAARQLVERVKAAHQSRPDEMEAVLGEILDATEQDRAEAGGHV